MVKQTKTQKSSKTAQILDGAALSNTLTPRLTKTVAQMAAKTGIKPKLIIIQIGDLEESNTYIKKKVQFGEKIGAIVLHERYPNNVSEGKIIAEIEKYNADKSVHGIMIQLPIPQHMDKNKLLETIDQKKDVDGLTAKNTKLLFDNEDQTVGDAFVPATTLGVLTLLDHYKIDCAGKKVVMVGDSALVGRPTALAFLNRKSTLTICHDKTKNLKVETQSADILIVAVGKPHIFGPNFFRQRTAKNQIVIDVGFTVVEKNGERHVLGDVDFEKVKMAVRAITPVPGGVGPMTVYSLFENLVRGYENTTL